MSDRNPEYDLTAPHLPMNHPQNVERRLRDEIERLRAEVGEAIAERDRLFIRGREWAELSGRMERERDALRARAERAERRIADAPTAEVTLGCYLDADQLPPELALRRVALVVVND